MKVLIIEDNKSFAESLKKVFQEKGWEVFVHFSWLEAKKLLSSQQLDLVVIDILLPQTDGFEILNQIKSFSHLKSTHFILISSFFNEQAVEKQIPKEFQEKTTYLKKPIDEKVLNEKIDSLNSDKEEENSVLHPFYSNPGAFSLSDLQNAKNSTFHSPELLSLLQLLHQSLFDGTLSLSPENEENNILIHWNKGNIVYIDLKDTESYFGNLLVEHGFTLQETLQEVLEQKTATKPIGYQLIEKGLLSPHIVHFILREQIKIRLNQILSYRSFTMELSSKEQKKDQELESVDFNGTNMAEWMIDCIKTKITDSQLNFFFKKYKTYKIKILDPINLHINSKFIEKYNLFYTNALTAQNNLNLENLVQTLKQDKPDVLKMLYFGIVHKSFYLKNEISQKENQKKRDDLLEQILKENNNRFEEFNLPWQASKAEVSARYKQIAAVIHPDTIPSDVSEELKKKYENAFVKITESYKTLTDEKMRKEYLEQSDKLEKMDALSFYEKGIKAIQSQNYSSALQLFSEIEKNDRAPENISLYVLWAKIKAHPEKLKNPSDAGLINKQINAFPMELRVSPLFWFVMGLYNSYTGNYEKAYSLFKKAIQIKSSFTEAKKELLELKKKLHIQNQKKEKVSFLNLFKKSS